MVNAVFEDADLTLEHIEEKAKFTPYSFRNRETPPLTIQLTEEQIASLTAVATPAWPLSRLLRLAERWVNHWSTSQIGLVLYETKKAIFGKIHRLIAFGILEGRPLPIHRLEAGQEYVKKKRPPYVPVRNTLPKLPSQTGEVVVLFEAPLAVPRTPTQRVRPSRAIRAPGGTKHVSPFDNLTPRPVRREEPKEQPYGRRVECQWPIGEPGSRDFRFCCDTSEPGRSYCEGHCKVAYVHVRDRREDAFA